MQDEVSQYLELSGPNLHWDIEAVFSFTFVKGCAAHYGSMSYAGDPGEPDHVRDLEVKAIYRMMKNTRGDCVRGPQLEMTQWLRDFCVSSLNEDTLLDEVRDDH